MTSPSKKQQNVSGGQGNIVQQGSGRKPGSTSQPSRNGIQGEGNYDAAREFDEAERKFVESGKVDAAARAAAPRSEKEQQEMQDAERKGQSRAKEEDPALGKPQVDDTTIGARGEKKR